MAEETAVLTAPAAAAPSDSGGGAPTTPSAPSAPQTDEQILGIEPIGAKIEEASPVPEAEQVADPAAPKVDAAADAEKIAEDGRLMPVKWRDMAKADPEFRTLFYTAKSNAEKLALIEPEFTTIKAEVDAVRKSDQAYLSGDPVAIQGELKTFLGDKPDAILPMLTAGENLLKEINPQEYARVSAERLTGSLKEIGMDRGLAVLRQALDAGDAGTETLRGQVAKILEYFDGNGLPTTEQARLNQQKTQLDAREAANAQRDEQSYTASSQSFRTDVNAKVETAFTSEIKTALDKVLEKSAFPEGARTRISADVKAALYKKLGESQSTIDTINRAIWPNGNKDGQGKAVRGNWNDASRKVATDAPIAYAKTILNDVIAEVVNQYTKDFIATAENRGTRAAAAASRTEIAGGSTAPRTPRPLSKKDIDYGKQSDNDILGL